MDLRRTNIKEGNIYIINAQTCPTRYMIFCNTLKTIPKLFNILFADGINQAILEIDESKLQPQLPEAHGM